jgi:ATP-binding cassette subfamily C (CFTR/MRP) protein 1/ATP-binding cassette subfamily C (CFTR/MRP) protein 2
LTSFIIYCVVICIVELVDQYSPSSAGLVLTHVLSLLVYLQWSIRMFGDVHEKMASIKQVTYYGNCVKQEASAVVEANRPAPNWPHQGRIQFLDVRLRYQEFGVDVLKNVNLNINPKEKIGTVGRTGSGKSSLLISLLRIVELSGGRIVIDGLDVAKIGLRDLRSRIAGADSVRRHN